jgi:hypothetical protein
VSGIVALQWWCSVFDDRRNTDTAGCVEVVCRLKPRTRAAKRARETVVGRVCSEYDVLSPVGTAGLGSRGFGIGHIYGNYFRSRSLGLHRGPRSIH